VRQRLYERGQHVSDRAAYPESYAADGCANACSYAVDTESDAAADSETDAVSNTGTNAVPYAAANAETDAGTFAANAESDATDGSADTSTNSGTDHSCTNAVPDAAASVAMLHVRHVRTMCRRRSNIAVCVPLVPSRLECGWRWFVYRRRTRCVVSSRLRRQPRCRSERVHHEPAHAVADAANCCAYARADPAADAEPDAATDANADPATDAQSDAEPHAAANGRV